MSHKNALSHSMFKHIKCITLHFEDETTPKAVYPIHRLRATPINMMAYPENPVSPRIIQYDQYLRPPRNPKKRPYRTRLYTRIHARLKETRENLGVPKYPSSYSRASEIPSLRSEIYREGQIEYTIRLSLVTDQLELVVPVNPQSFRQE